MSHLVLPTLHGWHARGRDWVVAGLRFPSGEAMPFNGDHAKACRPVTFFEIRAGLSGSSARAREICRLKNPASSLKEGEAQEASIGLEGTNRMQCAGYGPQRTEVSDH